MRKDGLIDKYDPALFPLVRKLVSKNALAMLGEVGVNPNRLFKRHAEGQFQEHIHLYCLSEYIRY